MKLVVVFLKSLNEFSGLITALITAIYVFLTWKLIKHNKGMVEAMKKQLDEIKEERNLLEKQLELQEIYHLIPRIGRYTWSNGTIDNLGIVLNNQSANTALNVRGFVYINCKVKEIKKHHEVIGYFTVDFLKPLEEIKKEYLEHQIIRPPRGFEEFVHSSLPENLIDKVLLDKVINFFSKQNKAGIIFVCFNDIRGNKRFVWRLLEFKKDSFTIINSDWDDQF